MSDVSVRLAQQAMMVSGIPMPRSCPDGGACDGTWGSETETALRQWLTQSYGAAAAATFAIKARGGNLSIANKTHPTLPDKVVSDIRTLGFQYVPNQSYATPSNGPVVQSRSAVTPTSTPTGGSFSMPTWGWGLIGAGVVFGGFFLWRKMK